MGSIITNRAVQAWCLLIACIAIPALYTYHLAHVHTVGQAVRDRGQMMLDVVESSVAGHLHNNKYQVDRLAEIVRALSDAPYVSALGIAADSATLAGAAMGDHTADRFFFQREADLTPIDLRQDRDRGPNARAGWRPFPEGPVTLWVSLTDEEWRARMGEAWLEVIAGSVLAVIVMVVGALFLHTRARQEGLTRELAKAEARAAQKAEQAQIAIGLTHETKNPLGIVRGLAQGIESTADASESHEKARAIVDEVDRTVRQINAFLELSRTPEAMPTVVALHAMVQNLCDLLRDEAAAKGIVLAQEVPDVNVEADEDMLRRALLNLLINGIKACSPGDHVNIRGEVSGRTLKLAVQDSGCGIDPEDLDAVRRPYFSRFEGGTGLGLALVDLTVNAHGWTLALSSEPGAGTTVTLEGLEVLP